MSETRESDRPRLDLDAVLRDWPEAEKTEEEWDEQARSVVERLRRGERGATSASIPDENLFAVPVGQSDEPGHNSRAAGGSGLTHPQLDEKLREEKPMTMSADRERDRRSLQDLAKMAHGLTPPPSSVAPTPSGVHRAAEAKEDDSGIVDLAAASQTDPQASVRAQSTPLASQGLFDDEQHAAAPASLPPSASQPPMTAPLGVVAQPVPSIPPMPASVPPASMPEYALAAAAAPESLPSSQVPAEKKRSGAVVALVTAGIVALGAAAAGGFLYMKSHAVQAEPVAMNTVAPAPAEPVAVAVAEATTPAPAEAEPAPAPEDEGAMDPAALPTAAPQGKATHAPRAAAKVAAKPAAKPEGPAKMTEKDLAAAPAGPAGDLGAAMKKEVGDDSASKATPAAATNGKAAAGNVPQKPSQGAVTGAIGAVLPGARACLGPDDPISRASIVFTSGGSVESVRVSGAAAGKPAEACIKGALTKAKVQPFAEPTYTANVTIRHN